MPRRLPSSAPPSNVRRKVGAGFGALFVLGGAIAPFVLAGSADDRFLMMIGFAPIAAIGAFLIWVFTRTPAGAAPVAGSASAAAKAQTKPASKMTAALTALAVMLTIVVVLVLLATLLQVAGS